jgi:hypothetical protein
MLTEASGNARGELNHAEQIENDQNYNDPAN